MNKKEEYELLRNYDLLVAQCHKEIAELGDKLVGMFRNEVLVDRKAAREIADRLISEQEKLTNPYKSEGLNAAFKKTKILGKKAEEEFKKVVNLLGEENFDISFILPKIYEKYSPTQQKIQTTKKRRGKGIKQAKTLVTIRLTKQIIDYFNEYPNFSEEVRNILTEHVQKNIHQASDIRIRNSEPPQKETKLVTEELETTKPNKYLKISGSLLFYPQEMTDNFYSQAINNSFCYFFANQFDEEFGDAWLVYKGNSNALGVGLSAKLFNQIKAERSNLKIWYERIFQKRKGFSFDSYWQYMKELSAYKKAAE